MVESKSGRKVFDCERCNRIKTSKARGFFYTACKRIEKRFYLILTCKSCKKPYLIEIKEPFLNKIRLGTGRIMCCFHSIFKVIETKDSVILSCVKCGKQRKYSKVEATSIQVDKRKWIKEN